MSRGGYFVWFDRLCTCSKPKAIKTTSRRKGTGRIVTSDLLHKQIITMQSVGTATSERLDSTSHASVEDAIR